MFNWKMSEIDRGSSSQAADATEGARQQQVAETSETGREDPWYPPISPWYVRHLQLYVMVPNMCGFPASTIVSGGM